MASIIKHYVKSNAVILNKRYFFLICSKNTDDSLNECRQMYTSVDESLDKSRRMKASVNECRRVTKRVYTNVDECR